MLEDYWKAIVNFDASEAIYIKIFSKDKEVVF